MFKAAQEGLTVISAFTVRLASCGRECLFAPLHGKGACTPVVAVTGISHWREREEVKT
jgi:hypothetical protein